MKKIRMSLLFTTICIMISMFTSVVFADDTDVYETMVPGVDYVADELIVYTKSMSDYDVYKDGSEDFYGVPILGLKKHVWHRYETDEELEAYLERTDGYYTYVITIDPQVITALEAMAILNNVENVKASLNGIGHVDGYLPGDVNNNGKIDARDYLLLKRAFFGTYELTGNGRWAADVDFDGKIEARDYLLLKRAFFGTYEIK